MTDERLYIESPKKKESPPPQWPTFPDKSGAAVQVRDGTTYEQSPYIRKTEPRVNEQPAEKERIVPSVKIDRTKGNILLISSR